MNEENFTLSLLEPKEESLPRAVITNQAFRDLGLEALIESQEKMGINPGYIKDILLHPPTDVKVIEYRQEILKDYLENQNLDRDLAELLPKAEEISYSAQTRRSIDTPILEMIWRLGELDLYLQCVEGFSSTLEKTPIKSRGLQNFRSILKNIRSAEEYQSLKDELPRMREAIRRKRSLTVGINLNERLKPVEATILSLNDTSFKKMPFIERIFGTQSMYAAATHLHRDPSLHYSGSRKFPLSPLFQDLEDMLKPAFRAISKTLKKYLSINAAVFSKVARQLEFYSFARKLANELGEKGLPVVFPSLQPQDNGTERVRGLYNPVLAFSMPGEKIVKNDFFFDKKHSAFWILTGPNQGGKTTFLRAVGIFQVLGQSGLFIPGQSGSLSPADMVITHFPSEEAEQKEEGRLAEEASRLSGIFNRITKNSIVLLNETLSSTAPGEGVYIGREIIKSFLYIGVRGVYATHLHELAEGLEELNREFSDSRIGSLVAGVKASKYGESGIQRTFRVSPGPPLGKSYAIDIAERFGISYERIQKLFKKK
jgi:DNA mismatch repair protein MutS